MKKVALYLIVALGVALGCSAPKHQFSKVEGMMLGTTLSITADITSTPAELYAAAMQLDSYLKAEMSLFDPNSLLSRINRAETDSLTDGLVFLLHLSDSVSRVSGGAYDITVAPLVKAYGFGSKSERVEHPNIDSLLEFVGYEKISVKDSRLVRQDLRTQIDLNSIAKGYIVDKLAQITEQMGAKNLFVDIGGEIVCRGTNPHGDPWRIGVESPFDGNMSNGDFIQKRIAVDGSQPMRAMATSGNYRRFYLDDQGNKVAHTIDPTTGHSRLSSLLSATVVAPTCALADAYGTMFMALGSDKAIEVAERLTDAEVYFIFADTTGGYREYISPGMQKMVMR